MEFMEPFQGLNEHPSPVLEPSIRPDSPPDSPDIPVGDLMGPVPIETVDEEDETPYPKCLNSAFESCSHSKDEPVLTDNPAVDALDMPCPHDPALDGDDADGGSECGGSSRHAPTLCFEGDVEPEPSDAEDMEEPQEPEDQESSAPEQLVVDAVSCLHLYMHEKVSTLPPKKVSCMTMRT